ncbi:MAG: FeoA domain-containing protein [Mycoplasma sp.]
MEHLPISKKLVNKLVKVISLNFDDENIIKKLNNLGLYKDQLILIKEVGNMPKMLAIEINGITNVLRIEDLQKVIVTEVIND